MSNPSDLSKVLEALRGSLQPGESSFSEILSQAAKAEAELKRLQDKEARRQRKKEEKRHRRSERRQVHNGNEGSEVAAPVRTSAMEEVAALATSSTQPQSEQEEERRQKENEEEKLRKLREDTEEEERAKRAEEEERRQKEIEAAEAEAARMAEEQTAVAAAETLQEEREVDGEQGEEETSSPAPRRQVQSSVDEYLQGSGSEKRKKAAASRNAARVEGETSRMRPVETAPADDEAKDRLKGLLIETGFSPDEFAMPDFVAEVVDRLGWRTFLEGVTWIMPNIVKDFYKGVLHKTLDSVRVRDAVVSFEPALINRIFKLRNNGDAEGNRIIIEPTPQERLRALEVLAKPGTTWIV